MEKIRDKIVKKTLNRTEENNILPYLIKQTLTT